MVGDADRVPEAGEVPDFDTRTPHWFGSLGDADVEILSLYGRTVTGTFASWCPRLLGSDRPGPDDAACLAPTLRSRAAPR